MPSTSKSPFVSSFNSAVKRGSSYNTAVWNIADRSNKSPEFVWNSLYEAGVCDRQKFNGQWVYFPFEAKKCNSSTWKNSQYNCWQWFCEWCISSGYCTPEQLSNHSGSQKEFMTYCRKFFGKQYTTGSSTNKTASKSRKSGYSFSANKRRSTTTRRYRHAA